MIFGMKKIFCIFFIFLLLIPNLVLADDRPAPKKQFSTETKVTIAGATTGSVGTLVGLTLGGITGLLPAAVLGATIGYVGTKTYKKSKEAITRFKQR